MINRDLRSEEWREYDFDDRIYRVTNPLRLYLSEGGTTHRILDVQGVVHCCPAPGNNGCVVRWKPKDVNNPVHF